MRTVTISVASRDDVTRRALGAFQGHDEGEHISFASMEMLWKSMTPKRWELLRVMGGAGPMTIREAARRAERDVKSVHGDVQVLIGAGVLQRHDSGAIEFPYDAVHVDFVVTKAA